MNQITLSFFLLFLLVSQIIAQNYENLQQDITTCISHNDKTTCTNVELSSGIYQCCLVATTAYTNYGAYSTSFCSVQVTPIKTFKEVMEMESTKALYKEIWGYVSNVVVPGASKGKTEMVYTCRDGTASMRFGFDTYTSEELEVLNDDNHCLSYFYSFQDEEPAKEDCFEAVILQSSKDAGLTCGYYEFNIKYSDGTSKTYKTFNLFNSEATSKGQLDDKSKESFETYITSVKEDGKTVISYKVVLSDDKGNSVVYDSLTKSISSSSTNSGAMTSLFKYLLLINLLLL